MKFKIFFNKKKIINKDTIHDHVNFMEFDSCRNFLNNIYINNARVEFIQLSNGERVKMEDIPDDQVIQRAQEMRGWIIGAK
jgi:hypothetical protein